MTAIAVHVYFSVCAKLQGQREQLNVRASHFVNKSRTSVQLAELFRQAQREEGTRDKSANILQLLSWPLKNGKHSVLQLPCEVIQSI